MRKTLKGKSRNHKVSVTVVIVQEHDEAFPDAPSWIGQCLEYFIRQRGNSSDDVKEGRLNTLPIFVRHSLYLRGRYSLEGSPRASEKYWELYR